MTWRFWNRKPTQAPRSIVRWGLLWHSKKRLDGERTHILCDQCKPLVFLTRADARRYADERYGYIAERPDLRAEPHGWRKPSPVRLMIKVAL